MPSFYCKLFVVYMLFTTVMCYADITSVECVNFENEPYCYDAGYMTIKGSDFDIGGFKDVFKVDNENMLYFLINQTVSNSSYIYAQFHYDKADVPQGPHLVSIKSGLWYRKDYTVSVLYGGFYNSDLPVWTWDKTDTTYYVSSQSTNYISNQTILRIYGYYYFVVSSNFEVHFYCTEPGYTGLMPRCSLVSPNSGRLDCVITDAIPTNYTFRYVVKEVGANWYVKNANVLPELHIV